MFVVHILICLLKKTLVLDILFISSAGDPTLEPPKVSLDPPPPDAEVPKIVEDADQGDSSEKVNLEAPPPPTIEPDVSILNNIFNFKHNEQVGFYNNFR